MFLCELFQGIYVGKLLFTHSFKIYVKLSVLQHKIDAVHTIGTNTYKIIISISCLHVSQYIRQFVYRNPAATGILEFIPSFCVTRLFPCPQLNKLKIEVNIPIIFKNLIVFMLIIKYNVWQRSAFKRFVLFVIGVIPFYTFFSPNFLFLEEQAWDYVIFD